MNEWDRIYRESRLEKIPWHSSHPERLLVNLVNQGTLKPGRVLDMCSGDGTNSIYLASKGFEVSGVDISPTAVKIALERCRKKGLACAYTAGDVLKIRPGKKFDLIFDRGCFHHIPNERKREYVRNAAQLLVRKGKLFLKCFSKKDKWFGKGLSQEEIRDYFSPYFRTVFLKESTHIEPGRRTMRHFYTAFMEKTT